MTTEAKTPIWKNPYVIGFLVGALGLIAIRPIQQAVKGAPPPLLEPPAWSLTNHDGETFGSAQLAKTVWVADFMFTRCPSICPELTRKMNELRKRNMQDDVRFVSFSVDPENDTPEVLREYRKKLGIDDDRWIFLTGTKDEVHQVLTGYFKLHVGERKPLTGEGQQEELYDVAHTQQFVLFDQLGRMRALAHPDSHGLARLTDAVKLLVERGPDA
jgi:protein SCO1/2